MERRPHIAVLDDSRFVLEQTKKTLRDAGYDVSCFLDPAALTHEVLDAAALVLVDVNMREVFGDDVIGFLKERLGVRAPVFLYSSIGEAELSERAQRAGADGYVLKQGDVAAQVERALGRVDG